MIRDTIYTLLMSIGVNPGNSPIVLLTIAIAQLFISNSSLIPSIMHGTILLPYTPSDSNTQAILRKLGNLVRGWPFEKIYSEIVESAALFPHKLIGALPTEHKYLYAYSMMIAQQKSAKDYQSSFPAEFSRSFSAIAPYNAAEGRLITESLEIHFPSSASIQSSEETQHILSARKAYGIPYNILLEIYSIWYCNRDLFHNTDNPWSVACQKFPNLESEYTDIHVPDLFNLIACYRTRRDPVEFLSALFSSQDRYSKLESFYFFQLIYKLSYPRDKAKILVINPPIDIICSLSKSDIRGLCTIAISSESLLKIYCKRFHQLSFVSAIETDSIPYNRIFCFCRRNQFSKTVLSIRSICQTHKKSNDSTTPVYIVASDSVFTKEKSIFRNHIPEMSLTQILRLPAVKYMPESGKNHQDELKILLRFDCVDNNKPGFVQMSEMIDVGNDTAMFSPYKPYLPLDQIISSGKTLKGIFGDAKKELETVSSTKENSNEEKKKGIYFFSDDICFKYTISKDTKCNGYRATVFFEMEDGRDDLRFDIHRLSEDAIFSAIESIPFSDMRNAPRLLSVMKQRILSRTIPDPCIKTIWVVMHKDLIRDIDDKYNYYFCKDILFSPNHIAISNLHAHDYTREECEEAILTDYNEKWDTVDITVYRQLKYLLNRASESGFDVNTRCMAEILGARNRKKRRRDNSFKQLRKKAFFSHEQLNIVIPSYKSVFNSDITVDYNTLFANVFAILRVFLSPIDPDEWCALDMGDYRLITETRFMGLHIYKAIDEMDQIYLFRNAGKKQRLRIISLGDKLEEIVKLLRSAMQQIDPHACDADRPFLQIMTNDDPPVLRRLTLSDIKALDNKIDDQSGRKSFHHMVTLADGTNTDLGNKKGSIFKSNWKYSAKKIGFTDAERYYALGQKAKKPLDVNYTHSANSYLLIDYAKKNDRNVCDNLNQYEPSKRNSRKVMIIRIPPKCNCTIEATGQEFGLDLTTYLVPTTSITPEEDS